MPKYTFFPCSFRQFQPSKEGCFSSKRAPRFVGKEGEIKQKGEGVAASGNFFRPSRKSNRRFTKINRRKNLLNRRFVIVRTSFRRSFARRQGEGRVCENVKCLLRKRVVYICSKRSRYGIGMIVNWGMLAVS